MQRSTLLDASAVMLALAFRPIACMADETLVRSASSGAWSDAATWEQGQIPADGDRVLIRTGHAVTYDVSPDRVIRGICISGSLVFARDRDTLLKKYLRTKFVKGLELVPNTARLCIMNLYLHDIDADPSLIKSGVDSLAGDPGERFSVVVTNPPFGKKSSIAVVNEEGDLEKQEHAYQRQDSWTATKNKQFNFVQQVKTLLKINGRCATSCRATCCSRVGPARRSAATC